MWGVLPQPSTHSEESVVVACITKTSLHPPIISLIIISSTGMHSFLQCLWSSSYFLSVLCLVSCPLRCVSSPTAKWSSVSEWPNVSRREFHCNRNMGTAQREFRNGFLSFWSASSVVSVHVCLVLSQYVYFCIYFMKLWWRMFFFLLGVPDRHIHKLT